MRAAGVGDDVGPHVPRHDDGDADVRRVGTEVFDQRLGEPLDGELGRHVGGVRPPRSHACPEPVHAAGVDQHAVATGDQQRQECAGAVVHAPPVDRKGALPLFPAPADGAGATPDARVAEYQLDVIGGVLPQQLVAEPLDLGLIGDVARVAADGDAGLRAGLRHRDGVRHSIGVPVAGGDRAALRRQLADELAAHARTTAGHDRKLACEPIHRLPSGLTVCRVHTISKYRGHFLGEGRVGRRGAGGAAKSWGRGARSPTALRAL